MDGKYEFMAVDFDGTLCENRFPDIGEPKPLVIKYVKQHAEKGAKIILHTCRENGDRPLLDEAVAFCEKNEIPLFAVNENPANPYPDEYGTGTGRKLYADLYIDDKAVNVEEMIKAQGRRAVVREIIRYALLTVAGALAFKTANDIETARRGYEAIGGEGLFILLPLFYAIVSETVKELFFTEKTEAEKED